MPIRHSLQTPVRAADFINKSLGFTIQSAANQLSLGKLTVSTSVDNPTLLASYPALAFAETKPGRPSFLILTLAQQYTDTPVTISTDAPDYFQLATDSRPTFAPTLTLTPLPTGTYVHIRYAPNRTGLHRGQLFIETPYIRRTIALRGRSRGLLPALRSPHLPVRVAKPGAGGARAGSWRVRLLAIALASSLALGGYSYRCQLFPSLCTEGVVASRILTADNSPQPNQLTINENPKVVELTIESGPVETGKTRAVSVERKSTLTKKTLRRPLPDSGRNQRSVAASSGVVRNSVSRRALAKQAELQADVRPQRVPATNPASEESELERELNRKF